MDNANQTWQMLQINRDTITKVPVLDVLGGASAYADEQIALAHYYGNGGKTADENTELAVSMLLDDQPSTAIWRSTWMPWASSPTLWGA